MPGSEWLLVLEDNSRLRAGPELDAIVAMAAAARPSFSSTEAAGLRYIGYLGAVDTLQSVHGGDGDDDTSWRPWVRGVLWGTYGYLVQVRPPNIIATVSPAGSTVPPGLRE